MKFCITLEDFVKIWLPINSLFVRNKDSLLLFFRIGGDKIDIRFFMKPSSPTGLLLWSGPDEMLPSSDYIALGFVRGALQFRYNLGSGEAVISYNNSRLFDGRWHYIHAQR